MKQVLPWESVPGPIDHDCPAKQQAKWVQPGGWVFVALLLVGGLTTKFKIALVFAVFYTVTLLTKRDNVVTKRGLEIFFDMQISTQYYFWPWEEMFSVTHEEDYRTPGVVTLYFTMGDRTKRLFFPKKDKEAILSLARQQNPAIRIYDAADTKAKAEAARKRKQAEKAAHKRKK